MESTIEAESISRSWDTFLDAYVKVKEERDALDDLCVEMFENVLKKKQEKLKEKYQKITKGIL